MTYAIINSVLLVLNVAVFLVAGSIVVAWQNRHRKAANRAIERYVKEANNAKEIINSEIKTKVDLEIGRNIQSKVESYYKQENRKLLKETISSLINRFPGYEESQLLHKAVLEVLLEELNK